MTFNRALTEGFSVNKGEHGELVIRFCPYYLPDEQGRAMGMKYASEEDYLKMDADTQMHYYKVAKTRGYTVFNLDQTNIREQNPELYAKILDRFSQVKQERDNTRQTSIEALDAMIRDNTWVCPIQPDSIGRAYWSMKNNFIRVPAKAEFRDDASFYRTLVHEMIHSTSILPKKQPSEREKQLLANPDTPEAERERIQKSLTEPMRSFDYSVLTERAREELVAELGSAMVLTQIGMDAVFAPENVAYLQSWGDKLGMKEGLGKVEHPEVTKFKQELAQSGWTGNADLLLKDVAALGKYAIMDPVLKSHRVVATPSFNPVEFLTKVRDGRQPLTVMGPVFVPLTDDERKEKGITENVLGDIVKDAWQAAKVVMRDGLKIDLKQQIEQGEDFSKMNDKRREQKEERSSYKGKSRTAGSSSRKSSYSGKKYGR